MEILYFFHHHFSEDHLMDKNIYNRYAKSYLPNNKKDFSKLLKIVKISIKNYFFLIEALKKLALKKKI